MSGQEEMMSAKAAAQVEIKHAVGLHARPSVKFTKLAKTFAADVEMALTADGPWVDAKSIVKVMATKAPKGTVLYLRAGGEGAESAVKALVDLVERDFDEAAESEAHVRTA
jgi:phosphocarrier protein HPr